MSSVPSSSSPRRRRLAVAVVAGGLLLAGCAEGGGSPSAALPDASPSSSDPTTVLAAAFQATSGAGTARIQTRTEMSSDGGAGASASSTGVADGVIDFANDSRSIVTQLPTGGQIETRRIDGTLYTQVPQLPGRPAGRPWRKITLPPQASQSLASFDDPTQLLQVLRAAATSVREVGKERVRDADTTRYAAEIDLARLVEQSGQTPPPGAPDPTALLRQLLGRDTLPVDIWVDDQQRVRRLQTVTPTQSFTATVPPGPDGGGGGTSGTVTPTPGPTGSVTSTQEFYDFGVAVDVQPPPADQVDETPVRVPGAPPAPGAPAPQAPAPQAPAPGGSPAAPALPASAASS